MVCLNGITMLKKPELGDYNPLEHGTHYLNNLQVVPNQTHEVVKKIIELHKLHKGQSPSDAEFNYLDHAKRLDLYGVDVHKARLEPEPGPRNFKIVEPDLEPIKIFIDSAFLVQKGMLSFILQDSTNRDLDIGVTSSGLVVLQNGIKINTFSWAKIMKVSFKRKQFFIQLRREVSLFIELCNYRIN
ncbi:Protein 4.1-like protein [Armadillidium vulgare]|nr:Protein 4.1-like protein [Armadillidium vulgare]